MSRGGAEKSCENAGAGGSEKTWAKKSKKWLTNGSGGCIIFFVSSASVLRTKPNSGDLHSGSAVDSDSTCGSSILSSPTRPQPIGLRYFRGIAQLVARLVRDEEAVGSNPAAPTKKSRHTFVCLLFCLSEPGFEQGGGMKCRKQSHSMALFSPRVPTSRKVYPGRSRNTFVYWSFLISAAGFERARAAPQAGQSKAQWAFD